MSTGGPARLGSLSASLLARKGQARPAMRPQAVALGAPVDGEDDLGWNDMGADAPDLPPVLVQRQTLRDELAAPIADDTLLMPTVAKARAAFTLRLDPERHLRLRLAATLEAVSAQVLVTKALDTFLQSMPEVEALASQLPPRAVGDIR